MESDFLRENNKVYIAEIKSRAERVEVVTVLLDPVCNSFEQMLAGRLFYKLFKLFWYVSAI